MNKVGRIKATAECRNSADAIRLTHTLFATRNNRSVAAAPATQASARSRLRTGTIAHCTAKDSFFQTVGIA